MAERFLRLRDVIEKTALSRSTIYEKMHAGTFPKCFQISTGRVAWRESDVEVWQQARLREAGKLDAA
ncbi:AlpA family phage regulatory protein [Bradyrhizobium sediminis]|uniref:AlpA family phage regulatory protein n=1 Tax=Bradyrhizobium sediminis TaxID=2840469 RepID=A0A975NKD4_9BRAD|nr:AlpA family phage regulatory protein [Bradyrhizobium sediminis]QWG16131.1 AlpA family phage regulatory protein [Bradyrhizobium sediminis]